MLTSLSFLNSTVLYSVSTRWPFSIPCLDWNPLLVPWHYRPSIESAFDAFELSVR